MLSTAASFISRINKAYDALYVLDADGVPHPRVCVICDEIVPRRQQRLLPVSDLLKKKGLLMMPHDHGIPEVVLQSYRLPVAGLEHVPLSPRSICREEGPAEATSRRGRPRASHPCYLLLYV